MHTNKPLVLFFAHGKESVLAPKELRGRVAAEVRRMASEVGYKITFD